MSLASFFPQTFASRSPLSPIPSQNVFRNLSIDGARLGYHVRLDRGVEADRALRRFAVPLVHLSSHLCRCRAVPQVTLPFFLAHTVCWVRKVSECCSTGAPLLHQGPLNQRLRTSQRTGRWCLWLHQRLWYFILWMSAGLLVFDYFGYFCCFLACDLAFPQDLCSSQPCSLPFSEFDPLHFELFGHLE